MIGVLYTKTFQTALLSTLLFYVLANPDTFKMVKRIPGLKFVMKSTNEITHSGVITHALLFGVVLFLCVLLINKTLVQHFPFLNVVEHLDNEQKWDINRTCENVKKGAVYAVQNANYAVNKCHTIKNDDDNTDPWRGSADPAGSSKADATNNTSGGNVWVGDDGTARTLDTDVWGDPTAVPQPPDYTGTFPCTNVSDRDHWCKTRNDDGTWGDRDPALTFDSTGTCTDYQCSVLDNNNLDHCCKA